MTLKVAHKAIEQIAEFDPTVNHFTMLYVAPLGYHSPSVNQKNIKDWVVVVCDDDGVPRDILHNEDAVRAYLADLKYEA